MRLEEIMEATSKSVSGEAEEMQGSEFTQLIMRELGMVTDGDEVVRRVSEAVRKRVEEMLWPGKEVEVRKKLAEAEVDREVMLREIVRETLHLLSTSNG